MQNRIMIDALEIHKKDCAPRATSPGEPLHPDAAIRRVESIVYSLKKLAENLGMSLEVTDDYTSVINDKLGSVDHRVAGYFIAETMFQVASLAVTLGYTKERHSMPKSNEISEPIPCLIEELYNLVIETRRKGISLTDVLLEKLF